MSVSVSLFWSGIENLQECLAFFLPGVQKTTYLFAAIPSVTPLLLRQEEHHGELGEQAAEAGTTQRKVLGKMLKKEMVPWVWLLLAGASFFPIPTPLLQKGPQAKWLQRWRGCTAFPSVTGVVHVNVMPQFATLTSNFYSHMVIL